MSGLLALASGKGGVGKTFLAVSLAHALALRGRKVLLVDADLGLANIDVQLGLEPGVPLARAIRAGVDPAALVRPFAPGGFTVLGGGSCAMTLAGIGDVLLASWVERLEAMATRFDEVVVDLPSGLERLTPIVLARAQRLLVVGNNEPTTLTDNYALVKLTRPFAPCPWLVANGVADAAEGRAAQQALDRACRRFLGIHCRLLGSVRHDRRVPEAIRRQMPLLGRSPQAPAAADIIEIARGLVSEAGGNGR